ncbi:MAG: sulfite exporter TauE/SafE family protein [Gammaproteobacteria bacterium]|nr:sulfite exporter TauE/SafE family protein [Gammaproteobacteria bacterium]
MDYLVISLVALLASGLTLFSGFGLGTLLMPVVAIFFPVDVAIGITAVVHFANNLFKFALLGRGAHWPIVLRFGLPAIVFAFVGAWLLTALAQSEPLFTWTAFGSSFAVTPVKLVIGLLILGFVLLELSPRFAKASIDAKWMPAGGALSGFFGGLSGHQGAFRSAFLIKSGIDKQQFIATNIVLAVMVDMTRLGVYGVEAVTTDIAVDWALVATACIAAFIGAFFGARLIGKMTIEWIHKLVAALLAVVGFGLVSGLI